MDAYLCLFLPGFLALLLCLLGVRHRLKILLALVPFMLLIWSPMLEFGPYPVGTAMMLSFWPCAAVLATLITRAGRVRLAIRSVLAFTTMVGLVDAYLRLLPDLPRRLSLPAPAPTFAVWLNRFAPTMLAAAAIVVAPLLTHKRRRLGRRSGALGVAGYRLFLSGMMLLRASSFAASWWFKNTSEFHILWGAAFAQGQWLTIVTYAAAFMFLAGVITLGAAAVMSRLMTTESVGLFLALLPLVHLPVITALPLAYGFRNIPVGWPLSPRHCPPQL